MIFRENQLEFTTMPGKREMYIREAFLGRLSYQDGLRIQKKLRGELVESGTPGCAGYLLHLEHNPVITNGRFGHGDNLRLSVKALSDRGVEVYETDRGGDVTYHGPGQLVSYPILNLRMLGIGAKDYICCLEKAVIRVLSDYGIEAATRTGYPGVWAGAEKIASVGVSISRGVTMHGTALNVSTDINYFSLIVPCGIDGVRMTSVLKLTGGSPELSDAAVRYGRYLSAILGTEMKSLVIARDGLLNPAYNAP